ncbi:uncharacterized protein [Pyrus communis]|uniref:uncharacterized protein n=1 Tax=Pyrus communis TaxID=23211 RepID=UPI0035C0078D
MDSTVYYQSDTRLCLQSFEKTYFFTDSVFSRWLRNFHIQHCIKLSLIIGYGIYEEGLISVMRESNINWTRSNVYNYFGQFYTKLEEKIHAKEMEKNNLQA